MISLVVFGFMLFRTREQAETYQHIKRVGIVVAALEGWLTGFVVVLILVPQILGSL